MPHPTPKSPPHSWAGVPAVALRSPGAVPVGQVQSPVAVIVTAPLALMVALPEAAEGLTGAGGAETMAVPTAKRTTEDRTTARARPATLFGVRAVPDVGRWSFM